MNLELDNPLRKRVLANHQLIRFNWEKDFGTATLFLTQSQEFPHVPVCSRIWTSVLFEVQQISIVTQVNSMGLRLVRRNKSERNLSLVQRLLLSERVYVFQESGCQTWRRLYWIFQLGAPNLIPSKVQERKRKLENKEMLSTSNELIRFTFLLS